MTVTGQDIYELTRASRSYRRFDASDPVTREEVLELLETVRLAPTGNNLQPLRFHLVTDADQVAAVEKEHGWAALLKDFNGPSSAEELPSAYVGICVPAGKESNPLNLIDVGIAAQTLALAAAARGIGTCMIKSFKPSVNGELGLDEAGYELVLLVALGRPATDEEVKIEPADTEHKLAYWRSDGHVQHVPKLEVADLLV